MRVVLINSSGRSNGNTERLLKVLEGQLTKTAEGQHIALEISHVILSRQDIKVCRGCRCCFEQNDCPLKDGAAKIEELLSACDVLILASPVCLEDVNGIMKNWLDRMAFNCHRPAFYGKYAVTITTSGAKASSHSLNTMKNALTAWGIHVLSADNFRMGAYMDDERIAEQYISKLSDIAENIIGAFQKDAAQKPTLFSLVSFSIQQKYYRCSNNLESLDHSYWEKKGWLNLHVRFYMSIRCNPVKLWAARIIGVIFSKLFI